MIYPSFFDSINSSKLFCFEKEFNFLTSLYKSQKLPKVLMFTGEKGSGKSTLAKHFLFSIFDQNYNSSELSFTKNSSFINEFKNNIFPNIIYVKGSDFQSVKIDDIRNLKKNIYKSSVLNKDRFIILDDIELFNINCLNALLKVIEEPSKNNYFFLINNKSKPLINTIKSRSLELTIILNESRRLQIIDNLINFYQIEMILNPKKSRLSPGNFIIYNHILNEFNISLSTNLLDNLSLLLSLYKKNKDILFINVSFFIVDFYFKNLLENNVFNKEKNYETKNFILKNLNDFLLYNINQNSLLNILKKKISYE